MGTNYYAYRIPTEEEMQKMHELLDKHCFDSLKELIDESAEEVHLCKVSYGWKVCFDHNWGKYYQPNRKSLEEFISQPNIIIKNEYGETFTPEEFWEEIEDHDAFCHNIKSSKDDAKIIFQEEINKVYRFFNISTKYNDFFVDGLRFAVYTDFC